MKIALRIKIALIERKIKSLLKAKNIKPLVWWFGAYYIDPKCLVFVVGVPTDDEKYTLKNDLSFIQSLNELLSIYNWPIQARKSVKFDIESQQTVERETDGNWWYHYK